MVVTAESNKTDRMLLSALLSVKTMNPQGGAYYILPQNIIILQLWTVHVILRVSLERLLYITDHLN